MKKSYTHDTSTNVKYMASTQQKHPFTKIAFQLYEKQLKIHTNQHVFKTFTRNRDIMHWLLSKIRLKHITIKIKVITINLDERCLQ